MYDNTHSLKQTTKATPLPRRYFTKQRRALSAIQRKKHSRNASRRLHTLRTRLPRHAKVGMYYNGFGELPTQPILDWCKRMGYYAYLPVVSSFGKQKNLRFSPIHQHKLSAIPTYTHSLGMKQHHHRTQLSAGELDIVFCPLVAVDKSGNRMGMGGGYYDRTLEKPHKLQLKKPLKVAWCYDFQLVDKLNNQPWDVAMDKVIVG